MIETTKIIASKEHCPFLPRLQVGVSLYIFEHLTSENDKAAPPAITVKRLELSGYETITSIYIPTHKSVFTL
jgi:hypothetical protein